MNRTLIKISIIISVIYLVYLILDHNDCLRCLKLYFLSPLTFIDNYKCIDKTLNRTVVNIFTTPEKLSTIYPTLNSILDQTQRIDMIYVSIAGDSEIDSQDVEKLEKICVLIKTTEKNIQPLILREGDSKTLIININEIKMYDKKFIENCVNKTGNCKGGELSYNQDSNFMIYKNMYITL